MKTAQEMYNYCLENKYGSGFNKKWAQKHFALLEESLLPNENVLMSFIGLHNFESMSKHDDNCAYAITDKRILIGQKKVIGEALKIVSLDMLNDVTSKSGMMFGIITFDTIKEKFNVALDKQQAKNILSKIHEVLYQAKSQPDTQQQPQKSVVDELKGLKELLDLGVLTQEEFDAQKAKILS